MTLQTNYTILLLLCIFLLCVDHANSFTFIGFLTKNKPQPPAKEPPTSNNPKSPGIQRIQLEEQLLKTIKLNNRLDNSDEISNLVSRLESSGWSIPQPAIAPQVIGKWKLVHTNNAEIASPIQRKAVDSSAFDIYQDIILKDVEGDDGYTKQQLVISQIVKFGLGTQLCVDALASTSKYPLAELTERKGSGKILGMNILGVSINI